MHALVCHKDETVLNKIKLLSRLGFELLMVDDYQDGLDKMSNNVIDLVLIDFSNQEYKRLLEHIQTNTPDLKTITISNQISESCKMIGGCDECIQRYERRRLLNTFDIVELIDIVKNFDEKVCHYYGTFAHVESILSDILKRFAYAYYDSDTKVITLEENNTFSSQSLIAITNILTQHQIKYTVIDDVTIQLV